MINSICISHYRRNNLFSLVVIVFIALLFGIGFFFFPLISDDLSYRVPFMATLPDGYLRWEDVWNTVVERMYSRDNIRFANILMIFLLPFPKWFTAAASAIVMAYALWVSFKLCKCLNRKRLALLLVSYMVFVLPWNDQMYVFDFQLNYVWASAVMLYMLTRVLNGGGRVLPSFFIGVLVGMWHEGFSIPLTCGIIMIFLLSKPHRTKSNYAGLVGLLIGILWLVTVPSTMARMKWTPPFASRYETVLLIALPAIVFVLTAVYFIIRRKAYKDLRIAVFLSIVLSSLFIMLVTKHGPRVGWCALWMAGVGFVYLCGEYIHKLCASIWVKYISCFIYAFAVLHLIFVDVMCYRLGTETSDILEEYNKNHEQTIFHKLTLRQDAPMICFQRPYYDWFAHKNSVKLAGDVYGGNGPKVVPIELRMATRPENVCGTGDFFIYCGYIVGPALSDSPFTAVLNADYGNGLRMRDYYCVPFVSEADGCKYAWYYPDVTFLDQILGNLESISFPEEDSNG